jgi:hypothetical protein
LAIEIDTVSKVDKIRPCAHIKPLFPPSGNYMNKANVLRVREPGDIFLA